MLIPERHQRGARAFADRPAAQAARELQLPVADQQHADREPWPTCCAAGRSAGNLNATSGTPFTATVNGERRERDIPGAARAEATGLPVTSGSGFFNTAAFVVPAIGTFGNAGRDTIPGYCEFLADRVVLPLVPARREAADRVPDRQHEPDQSRQYYRRSTRPSAPYNTDCRSSAGGMRTMTATVRLRF